ncbi:unnamed protein product, partial [Iphiclides podalirius]
MMTVRKNSLNSVSLAPPTPQRLFSRVRQRPPPSARLTPMPPPPPASSPSPHSPTFATTSHYLFPAQNRC